MQRRTICGLLMTCGLVGGIATAPAAAADVMITIENVQPADGFFFTPVWLGFHDGSFDLFDSGSLASSELKTIAETGDAGPLDALFGSATNGDGSSRASTVVTSPAGFGGAPVFDPGESVTQTVMVPDAASNRYLSLASMVIPSNDAFFGNGDPTSWEIFSADGSFNGPLTIEIMGSNIYDAGTELNNTMGAAFSAIGGTGTVESMGVALHTGLDNFLATDTVAETTINSALGSDVVLARIQIQPVPEPASSTLAVFAVMALGWLRRRVVGEHRR